MNVKLVLYILFPLFLFPLNAAETIELRVPLSVEAIAIAHANQDKALNPLIKKINLISTFKMRDFFKEIKIDTEVKSDYSLMENFLISNTETFFSEKNGTKGISVSVSVCGLFNILSTSVSGFDSDSTTVLPLRGRSIYLNSKSLKNMNASSIATDLKIEGVNICKPHVGDEFGWEVSYENNRYVDGDKKISPNSKVKTKCTVGNEVLPSSLLFNKLGGNYLQVTCENSIGRSLTYAYLINERIYFLLENTNGTSSFKTKIIEINHAE
jgi:hypothetical protein